MSSSARRARTVISDFRLFLRYWLLPTVIPGGFRQSCREFKKAAMQTTSTSPAQVLGSLIVPMVLLVAARLCLGRVEEVTAGWLGLWWALPYLALGATGLLASRFHSSRMLFTMALLGASLAALQILPGMCRWGGGCL